MSEPLGQILPGSKFGECLTEIAKKCETILEVGTWHGLGSTLCLANGLVRATQRIWTIDQSKAMWLEAKKRYESEERIRFICAHTVDVLDEVPPRLDLVLFDGNDDQTELEFDLLIQRIEKFIALDDTNERKNRRQLAFLSTLPDWKFLKGSSTDRNGWAVFEKP